MNIDKLEAVYPIHRAITVSRIPRGGYANPDAPDYFYFEVRLGDTGHLRVSLRPLEMIDLVSRLQQYIEMPEFQVLAYPDSVR